MNTNTFGAYLVLALMAFGLTGGAWALYRRYRLRLLRLFFSAVAAFAVYGFLCFGGRILSQALYPADPFARELAARIAIAGGFPAFSIFLYGLFRWAAELFQHRLSVLVRSAFWVSQAVIYAGFFLAVSRLARAGLPGRADESFVVLNSVVGLILLLEAAYLIAGPRFTPGLAAWRARLGRGVGAILGLGWSLTVMSGDYLLTRLALPPVGQAVVSAGLYFLILGLPLGFLGWFVTRHHRQLQPTVDSSLNPDWLRAEYGLTARELEIIELVMIGRTNREIATVLEISPKTVKNTISAIYRKTGAANRVELTNFMRELSDRIVPEKQG
jgi:DNA-binding CsgD family transcriptional regulator